MLRIARFSSSLNQAYKEKLKSSLKDYMKSKNKLGATVVRSCLADITLAEKANREFQVSQIILKAISKRQESIQSYKDGNRLDLVDNEQQEVNILQQFLPKQMTEAEIEQFIRKQIEQIDSPNLGKVMKQLNAELDPAVAPRKLVSEIAKSLLNSK